METNKENRKTFVNNVTKIPLPLLPLPPIPHALKNSKRTEIVKRRAPLNDIKPSENVAPGPSRHIQGLQNQDHNIAEKPKLNHERKLKSVKSKNPVLLDTRHVTVRHNNKELDWNYNVFCDDLNSLMKDGKSITNTLTPIRIENNSVKKLKRSLKRPHSRELQLRNENGEQNEKVDITKSFLSEKLVLQEEASLSLSRDYVDDIFSYLLAQEQSRSRPAPCIGSDTRACVINWLVKVNASVSRLFIDGDEEIQEKVADGYPTIIQAACWYFDTIVTAFIVDISKLQLISAACYWIALKLNGQAIRGEQMAKFSGHAFTAKKLSYVEECIVKKLKFPSLPIVPHEFITYFARWCDPECSGEIEAAATFICLAGLMVNKKLCGELPSTIAVACTINALVLLKKKDLLHRFTLCPVYKEIEKRSRNFNFLDPILRTAIRIISHPSYEYNALVNFYESPPFPVAAKIIEEAHKMVHIDAGYSRSSSEGASYC